MSQLSGQRLPHLPATAPLRKGDLYVVPSAAAAASRTGEARANPYTSADALTRVYAPTPPPRPLDGAAPGGRGRAGHGRRARPPAEAPQRAAPHRLMPLGGTQAAQAAYAADALRFAQAIEESQRTALKFEERREWAQLRRCVAEGERQIAAAPPQPEQLTWQEAPPLAEPSARPPHELMVAFEAASSVDESEERSGAATPESPSRLRAMREAVADRVVDDVLGGVRSAHDEVAPAPPQLFAEFCEPPRPPAAAAAAAADASTASLPEEEDVQQASVPVSTAAEAVTPHDAVGLRRARELEASRWVAVLLDTRPTPPAAVPLAACEEAQPHTPVLSRAAPAVATPTEELRARRMSEAARLVAAIAETHERRAVTSARDVATTSTPQPAAEPAAALPPLHSETVGPDVDGAAELRALRGGVAADLVHAAVQSAPPQLPPLPRLTSSEEAAPHPVAASRHTSAGSVGATLRQLRTALSRSLVTSLAFPPAPSPRPSLSRASVYAAAAEESAGLAVTLSRPPAPLQAAAVDVSARAAAAPHEPSVELYRLRRALAHELVASLAPTDPAAGGLRAARRREAQLLVRSIV